MDNIFISIKEAFSALMGVNGDEYVAEIHSTGCLSESSYKAICNNIQYNSQSSVIKYFGLVHWYYLQGIKQQSAPKSITHHNYQPGNGDSNYNGVDKNWAGN
jgi:hypothetical protein